MTQYLINDVPVRTVAQRIETAEGTQTAPSLVGEDLELPGLDGGLDIYELGQQRRLDGIATLTLQLSIRGVDPDTGAFTAGTTLAEYQANVDAAIRMFRGRSLKIDAVRPDGTTRRAYGHPVPGEILDFTRERSHPAFGRYVAAIAIPAGRWTDIDPVTTGTVALATGATLDLSPWADATAVCTDLALRFGPVLNPRLTKPDGHFAWGGVVASGRQLLVRTGPGLVTAGAGAGWTPGYSTLDYSPGPRLFEIDPTQPLEAVFTHGGGGTAEVEISGPRHYATS